MNDTPELPEGPPGPEAPAPLALAERYHPDLVAALIEVGPEARPGWRRVGTGWAPPAPPEPMVTSEAEIASMRFLERFTAAEMFNIEQAALALANKGQPGLWAQLRRMLAAQTVSLRAAEVIEAVRGMEAGGLLAAGRADAILEIR